MKESEAEKDLMRALQARRESRRIDFKATFDPSRTSDWCEIVKDILAMANSGGGCLVFGVRDDGNPAEGSVEAVLALDPAQITEKVSKYTGVDFDGFEIHEGQRDGKKVAILRVAATYLPIPFARAGNYDRGDGKQSTAFQPGTTYFRHGAKSAPGTAEDIRHSVEREVDRQRRAWLGGIKKVIAAPPGHRVEVIPPDAVVNGRTANGAVRLTSDPAAPAVKRLHPDDTHPFRRKEVVAEVNSRLLGRATVTTYDIRRVRDVYAIDDGSHPDFYYESKYASPQYSGSFVDWVVHQFERNSTFFSEARMGRRV
ncbi:MAG: putative DNA binding domain-containing protein [Thermoplasmata archaeon]